MALEIERKFLVRNDSWRYGATGTDYRQGYLTCDPERTVRVRIAGERAFLTIKGKTTGMARSEFEYAIPPAEAAELLDQLCLRPLIEKTRYLVGHGGKTWEVDEFRGDNRGLVLAEIELDFPDEEIELPPWIAREVTADPRYFNSSLSRNPYKNWQSKT
ncbi:MAG: CYTH domain-containing protein [Desulfuromonadaceae bacterium]